jgi:hypothetical protein
LVVEADYDFGELSVGVSELLILVVEEVHLFF